MKENAASYSAANVFPLKLLQSNEAVICGNVIPIHAQIVVTNKCNLCCSFCSYSDRDKNIEISFNELQWVLDILEERGCKALTWTGGGEPLMYPHINDVIKIAYDKGMVSGLVSNGELLDRLGDSTFGLVWCRVSCADDRNVPFLKIENAMKRNPRTEWSLSYVVTTTPNYERLNSVIAFANSMNMTHVRVVGDLCDMDNVLKMDEVRKHIVENDERVMWQERKFASLGNPVCHVSILRPVISPEGIFPCCGVVYSINGQERRHIDKMRMGSIRDLPSIIDQQKFFNGSICDRCYYSEYNDFLKMKLICLNCKNFL